MRLKIVDEMEAEIRTLEHELRVLLPKEIKKALEYGDLRENGEYHAALERQEHLRIRLGSLQDRLRRLTMISPGAIPRDKAGYGSTIVVAEEGLEARQTYRLVTSEEADAERGFISMSSPLGKAFVGRTVGDEVEVRTPKGVRRFEVTDLKTLHDA